MNILYDYAKVSGTTLIGQRCAAILYAGFETLSAVGINATGQRGCYAVVSTDSADAAYSTTGGVECRLPPMPTGPDFPGDYQETNKGIAGKISIVDSTIDFAADVCRKRVCPNGDATAFSAVRSLFLQNVYVFNAANVYSVTSGGPGANATLLPTGGASALVQRLVYAVDPPVDPNGFALRAAIYLNGTRQNVSHYVQMSDAPPKAPPADLIARHRWLPEHPGFDRPGCVSAKSTGAKGNGVTDDYAAIQAALDAHACVYLPRGLYITSATLQVHSGRALVGVARHLTRITTMDSGLSFAAPRHANPLRTANATVRPVVEVLPPTTGGAGLPTFVGFLSISVWNTLQNTSALHWHSSGTYRQVHCNRANRCGSLWRPGCANSTRINYPLQLIRGAENVKLFTFFEEDCCHEHSTSVSKSRPGVPAYWSGFLAGPQGPLYRHLKVESSTGLNFYHLNCEHGTGEAICEFAGNSSRINVFGLKTEGRFVTLWIRDCDDVAVFGTGGCGCSANDTVYPPDFSKGYPPTLYRVERTPSILFSSLIDQHPLVPYARYPNISSRPRDMFDESPVRCV